MSRVTQYVTERRFGFVMTHARRPCLFTVRGDVRKMRQNQAGKRGKKESTGMRMSWNHDEALHPFSRVCCHAVNKHKLSLNTC